MVDRLPQIPGSWFPCGLRKTLSVFFLLYYSTCINKYCVMTSFQDNDATSVLPTGSGVLNDGIGPRAGHFLSSHVVSIVL